MSKNSNIIAVTMGDPSGVGTEIAIRAKIKKIKKPNFFIIHDPDFVKKIIKKMKSNLKVREINNYPEIKKILSTFPGSNIHSIEKEGHSDNQKNKMKILKQEKK